MVMQRLESNKKANGDEEVKERKIEANGDKEVREQEIEVNGDANIHDDNELKR